MIRMTNCVRVQRFSRGRWRTIARGRNSLTTLGTTGIRDRLAGDTQELGEDTEMRAGSTVLGTVDTGYPTLDAGDLLHRVTVTPSATLDEPTLTLHPTDSTAAWAELAGSDFDPPLDELTSGSQYRIYWPVSPGVSYRAGGDLRDTLIGLSGLTEANQAASLANRIGGLGGNAALTCRLVLFALRSDFNPDDRFELAEPDAANMEVKATISPISLATSGTATLRAGPYTFPAVTESAEHSLRWYMLAINQGNILLDVGEVTAGGVQQFGTRPDATTDQYIDISVG